MHEPLAEAFSRAVQAKAELLIQAGGAWTAEEVAAQLRISRQAVDYRRVEGTLLAVESKPASSIHVAISPVGSLNFVAESL